MEVEEASLNTGERRSAARPWFARREAAHKQVAAQAAGELHNVGVRLTTSGVLIIIAGFALAFLTSSELLVHGNQLTSDRFYALLFRSIFMGTGGLAVGIYLLRMGRSYLLHDHYIDMRERGADRKMVELTGRIDNKRLKIIMRK